MTKTEYIERYGEEAYQKYLEHIQQYYQQHKEEIREKKKQYRKEHKEQIQQYHQQYQKEHKEECDEYRRQYSRKCKCMFAFCLPEQIEQIENYELAKADNFNGWHIHHRMECVETGAVVNSSKQDLIDWGIYYNRPASELIFLTRSEHIRLHRSPKNRIGL